MAKQDNRGYDAPYSRSPGRADIKVYVNTKVTAPILTTTPGGRVEETRPYERTEV